MIPEIVSVEPTEGYRLRLTFDDGTVGEVDVSALVRFVGVFAPLRDPAEFQKVRVDAESGTVAWPNGADLDPLVLYSRARGVDIEELLATKSPVEK
ncbi:MAG: DUF2442 domain-containing protein [Acidobacteria bacterium]|nr:DUF2442 domain-containing protein [Acidobacteriota bacterium]